MDFDKDKDIRILSEEYGYRGFSNIKKYTLQHRLFSGSWSEPILREVYDHKADVAALPYDPYLDQVVLIQQFRAGAIDSTSPWLFEAVAGMVDDNETDLDQVISRELHEETRLEPQRLLKIHEYWVSPGGSNEFLTLYIAKVDASGAGGTHGLTEEGEDIRVQAYTSEAAFALLDNGLVNNALTIIALQWLRIHKEQLLTQWR